MEEVLGIAAVVCLVKGKIASQNPRRRISFVVFVCILNWMIRAQGERYIEVERIVFKTQTIGIFIDFKVDNVDI